MALSVSEVLPGTSASTTRRQIWSIGGGKGGIGKSLLAASIGWQLARMGRKVVLVDADLGGANLTEANLSGVVHDSDTTWPAGFTPPRSGVSH